MSDKESRDAFIKQATNDAQASQFIQELGSKARVDRTKHEEDERTEQLRAVLSDIGRDMQESGLVPKGCEYAGSFSVHVYVSPAVGTAVFSTLSAKGQMPVELADGALRELTGATMESYGKQRQHLRSGF